MSYETSDDTRLSFSPDSCAVSSSYITTCRWRYWMCSISSPPTSGSRQTSRQNYRSLHRLLRRQRNKWCSEESQRVEQRYRTLSRQTQRDVELWGLLSNARGLCKVKKYSQKSWIELTPFINYIFENPSLTWTEHSNHND